MATDETNSGNNGPRDPRAWIGLVVVILGCGGIILLAWKGAAYANALDAKERVGALKDLLSMVLPLVGAWVGTVLAFYFSRENFVAAADRTAALVKQLTPDQRLAEIPVTAVAIDMEKADKIKLDRSEAQLKIKADIIEGFFAQKKRNRAPFVQPNGVVKYILHRSMFDKFVAEQALQGAKLDDLTLEAMLKVPEYAGMATAFVTVATTAKLSEVKRRMEDTPDCSDAFVTQTGGRDKPAVGWITNVIVSDQAKLG